MRLAVKALAVLAILGVLAAGLLPPMFAQGALRNDADNAAQAGAAQLLQVQAGAASGSIEQAVAASVATRHGVRLISMSVKAGVVTVRITRDIHTFMSGVPGLEHWFHPTVTAQASAYGSSQ